MGIEEEFSKFTHEVEEKFHDVKEHVIMSVERHSFLIAFVLMTVTSAVLLIGTVYVWCYHGNRNNRRHGNRKPDDDMQKETVSKGDNDSKNGKDKNITELSSKISSSSPKVGEEQNDNVRKRIPSQSSSNTNNNESPVKSKIPVRARVKSTTSP